MARVWACLVLRPRGLAGCEAEHGPPMSWCRSHLLTQPILITPSLAGCPSDHPQHHTQFPWHYGESHLLITMTEEYKFHNQGLSLSFHPLMALLYSLAIVMTNCGVEGEEAGKYFTHLSDIYI